jgi:hypothetical protein
MHPLHPRTLFLAWTLLLVIWPVRNGYAQNNVVTIPVGTAGTINQFTVGAAPTQVFHASASNDQGLPAPNGYAELFYSLFSDATVRSEVSISAKAPKRSGRIYVENAGPIRVGAAFSNPNSEDVSLSFYFTDANGNDFGNGTATIRAHGQIARFLTEEPFTGPLDFRGTFTFNASAPITAMALRGYVNETGLFLMPQVPVAEIGAGPTTTSIVPYFAGGRVGSENCVGPTSEFTLPFAACSFIGGVISTELVLVNPTDVAIAGTFSYMGASPIDVIINGQTASTFSYSIPRHSSQHFQSAIGSAPARQGWIQITAPAGPQLPFAFAITSSTLNGITRYQTTVPGQSPSNAFRIVVRDALCCGSTPTFQPPRP